MIRGGHRIRPAQEYKTDLVVLLLWTLQRIPRISSSI